MKEVSYELGRRSDNSIYIQFVFRRKSDQNRFEFSRMENNHFQYQYIIDFP